MFHVKHKKGCDVPKISELPVATKLPEANEIILPVVIDTTNYGNYKVSVSTLAPPII